ncbi:MAG: MBL fold metallo-hydrolase [Treponema sp.]|jgi:phosphoribosyl 1,2-cyclic phosphodiesterase|nr:MBL fold metallo-hydrolase [Treponema sp.]
MRIRFWGVRGSLPSPQVPAQIQDNIRSILEQLTAKDIENPEARERFLQGLPPWLFGTIGGNTSCVSLEWDDPGQLIVFDAGSGIRELGLALAGVQPPITSYHIFFSHFHWDHLMGLPFFNPAYDPSVELTFYSPKPNLEAALTGQMTSPYFPVTMDAMGGTKRFYILSGPQTVAKAPWEIRVSYKKMRHPGDSYSYQVNDGKHRFIYATDVELSAEDFFENEENASFFKDADVAVIDSQYTLQDAIEKYNWGHSSFRAAADFAAHWGIKHLVLFHHEPTYTDREVYNILQSARWYTEQMQFGITLTLATEGLELIL